MRPIRHITPLYALEKEAWGLAPGRRVEIRQSGAAPIFDNLKSWLYGEQPYVLGNSSLDVPPRMITFPRDDPRSSWQDRF
ncbi:hypothetical protein JSE7799_00208 [Jannaschia seosinensis]|uniref:Uncharacterized protein n=1 Tax=Jannaschia seosinensis TaxID=313367 RepID=A0A0M7B829_9RHOB|nr:hypothetical protein JSE7799_00208 [Jannaschia seosinensis]